MGTGTDDEKLGLLHRFAETDHLIAQPFPVPERFHTTVVQGNTQKKFPVVHLTSIEPFGGPQVLFEEAYVALERQLPAQTNLTIGKEPLICITPLMADESGEITPSFKGRASLDGSKKR